MLLLPFKCHGHISAARSSIAPAFFAFIFGFEALLFRLSSSSAVLIGLLGGWRHNMGKFLQCSNCLRIAQTSMRCMLAVHLNGKLRLLDQSKTDNMEKHKKLWPSFKATSWKSSLGRCLRCLFSFLFLRNVVGPKNFLP